jgi:hypothetical protein
MLFQYLYEGTGEGHEKPQSGEPAPGRDLTPGPPEREGLSAFNHSVKNFHIMNIFEHTAIVKFTGSAQTRLASQILRS